MAENGQDNFGIPEAYLNVTKIVEYNSTEKGFFPEKSPKGVVIHYAAHRNLDSVVQSLKAKDLGYHILIDRNGDVSQMIGLDRKCWHAGRAVWNGYSPNHHFVSIALLNWGWLTKDESGRYLNWAGGEVDPGSVIEGEDVLGNTMYWDKITEYQMISLQRFLDWITQFGVDWGNVCGHDECAIPLGRKVDPGGMMSVSVPEIREYLRAKKCQKYNLI